MNRALSLVNNTGTNAVAKSNTSLSYPTIDNLFSWLVGADHMYDLYNSRQSTSFPPYNIERSGDRYYITMAVAGYSRDDLTVEYANGYLTVSGERIRDDNREVVAGNLASRSFKREFKLMDTLKVADVNLRDGILTIELEVTTPSDYRKFDIR